MPEPEENAEEEARIVAIRQPPTANPARTRLGPTEAGPEPEEQDPVRPAPGVGREG